MSGRGLELAQAQSLSPLFDRLSLHLSVLLVCTSCRHGLENETHTKSTGTILCVSSINSWCLSKCLVLIRAAVKVKGSHCILLHYVKYSSQGHYAPPFYRGTRNYVGVEICYCIVTVLA